MKLNKPTVIFNGPRVGSSIMCRMLLKDNPKLYTDNLACFFSNDRTAKIIDGNIVTTHSKTTDDSPDATREDIINKLSILKELEPKRYAMKFNIGQASIWENGRKIIPEELWGYMLKNYNFIVLKRRNSLDQLLSWGLVKATGLWHNYTDIDDPKYPEQYKIRSFKKEAYPGEFTYRWEDFNAMGWLISEHERQAHRIPEEQRTNIFYEDMEDEFIARKDELGLIPMAYPKDKLELFQNKEEILEWYASWKVEEKK